MGNPVGLSFPTFSLPTREQVYKTVAPYVNRATGANIMPTAGAANIDAVRSDVNNKLQEITGGKLKSVDDLAQFDGKNKAANGIRGQLNDYLKTNNSIGISSYKQLMSPTAFKRLETVGKQSKPAPVAPAVSAPGGYELKPPGAKTNLIAINLERKDINNRGGEGRVGLSNAPGSSLTSEDAINRARASGIKVDVFNTTKGVAFDQRSAKMVAMLTLPNTGPGGATFADITAPPGGYQPNVSSYKVPPESSPAFKKGYADRTEEINYGKVLEGGKNIAEGLVGVRGSKITANVRSKPVTPDFVQPSRPANGVNVVIGGNAKPQVPRKIPRLTSIEFDNTLSSSAGEAQRVKNRSVSSQPYVKGDPIKGEVKVNNGVNLSNLGEFKLQSLADYAKKHNIPVSELRVGVYVRHGQSLANQNQTFAGGVLGTTGPNGFERHPMGNVARLPNGRISTPDGQIPLTDLGKQQARDANPLIRELREMYGIKNLLISPVHRAQDTAALLTARQPKFEVAKTVDGRAERNMGHLLHQEKVVDGVRTRVRAGNAQPAGNGPVTDKNGFEKVPKFNDRIDKTMNEDVLPSIYDGNMMAVDHQYVQAASLRRFAPELDVMKVGHNIPNGQPLVTIMRFKDQGPGQEPLVSLEAAGYYRGNKESGGVAP